MQYHYYCTSVQHFVVKFEVIFFYFCPGVAACYVQVFMLVWSHIYSSKRMDQPGKVANPARGQLNRENEYFPD